MIVVDKSYVVHVPPGWLLSGRVTEVADEVVEMTDAVYIESIASGHSPLALTESKNLNAWEKTYWIGDITIRRDAILLAIPMQPQLSTRQFAPQAQAIDRAGRKR